VKLKENINIVFEKLGGIEAMAQWASKYPTEFYKMYVKILESALKERTEHNDEIVIKGKSRDL